MKQKSSPLPPRWNLSDLFQGIQDPAIERLLRAQAARARIFAKTYKGKITPRLRPHVLHKALQMYEQINQELAKPEVYAELLFAADTREPAHGAFLQRMKSRTLEIYQILVFFETELSALPEKTLRSFVVHPLLTRYRHYLKLQLLGKPHRLSETEEKIFNDKYLTGRSRFVRLYDEELSNKAFRLPSDPSKVTRSESDMLNLLHSPKRTLRRAAAEGFTKGLREELRRLTFVTNTLLQDKQVDDRYHRYTSPEAARHQANEISQDMVDAMSDVVTKSFHLVQDFYRFKQRVLGYKLFDYDRYAPVASSKATFSFAEAKTIVLDAYAAFSPQMAEIANMFFENGWIDARTQLGKRSGAFCMFVTPDIHPYVFVNYNGTVSDIKTLAHELGHAVHAYLARKQSFLNFYMPLTVAETASVFGEMLVFDHLRTTLTDPKELFALYMEKIESIFATVHRQTAMYRFEQDLHTNARRKGELTAETISQLWRKRQTEMFGSAVTLTPDYDIWWSYISHFVHSPFYVYAYAFGELLTLALFAIYTREGTRMANQYLEMLSRGGSVTPRELVQPFKINLSDPTFWQQGIRMIDELIREAKELYKHLK